MTSKWETVPLGDVCKLTKGNSPTLKTLPGEYPLIVTGPEPLSSNNYQFDGEAVCIPMVSSTGHGHASLKRVHFANGKFAVANIITACEVLDTEVLSTRFLYLYLQHFKDDLIVSRMQGTANVSLSQKVLATVPIAQPPIQVQRRIVDLIGAVDDATDSTELEGAALAELRANIADHAWRTTVEVTSLGTLGDTLTGGTPPSTNPGYWMPGEVPFITAGDMDKFGIPIVESARQLSLIGARKQNRIVPKGSVLQVCIGASLGKVGVTTSDSTFNQQINGIVGLNEIDGAYLALLLSSSSGQATLAALAGKSTMPIVSKGKWNLLEIPWPDSERRKETVSVSNEMAGIIAACLARREALAALRSELLTSLLSGAHRIPETYDELMGA